jgi:hypothetical protein
VILPPALVALLCAAPAAGFPEPTWFPSAAYRPGLPRPDLGRAYTPHSALVAYARALAEAGKDRVRLETLHVTEEGRVQPLLVITSPGNLSRLEALKAANGRLADPRALAPGEAEALPQAQPVFVWLGYSVHGYEASGSEAALAVAYHYAASEDPAVLAQLEKVVLLLDLTQNPDGRDRHAQAVGEVVQGANPADGQDAQNQSRWPGGRFNHRLFDLNRDWAWQTQGESRAKAAAFLAWNPQVAADHHEMEPEASYYFPPTMLPVHEAIPKAFSSTWQAAFGRGLARAFDAQGLAYYSKERFDLFYPSYGDSWPSFHGAVGMTFEMATPGGLSYTRKDGENLTLSVRIHRHFTASLATVATAAENRHALLADFLKARREPVEQGEKAGAFLFPAEPDPGRAEALAELLRRNGVEVQRTSEALSTAGLEAIAVGKPLDSLPAGSYLVPLDQPNGPIARALLEREARMGEKPSYDVTAWSLPLTHGVPAFLARTRPKVGSAAQAPGAPAALPEARWAYLLPSGFEGRERTLAALLKEGFKASVASEPFRIQGRGYGPGTVIFPPRLNDLAKLRARLQELAGQNRHPVAAADSALVETGPDLGSFKVGPVKLPRIAVLMDRPASPTALGAVIHVLREAGLPFAQLRADRLGGALLHRYTHLVVPGDGSAGNGWKGVLGEAGAARLKAWCAEGGTLVGLEGGAVWASRAGLTDTGFRFLARGAEEARLKEKDPKKEPEKRDPADLVQPWAKREERALRESIPGALLRVKVDTTHPLAWGLHGAEGAVLNSSDTLLELSAGGENPLAYPGPAKDSKEAVDLRLSGLLPKPLEAKLHHTAYALRERKGRGGLILFAGDPVFRGASPYTTRAFLNALLFGAYGVPDED